MRPEEFRTQARLLSVTRRPGHLAHAQDTDNSFMADASGGWAQLLPKDGLAGQPLVMSGDRAQAAFATSNHLVPQDGSPGQLVGINPDGMTRTLTRDTGSQAALPVLFTDGSKHTIYTLALPGGSLGPNGFVRAEVVGDLLTNAARTVTFTVEQTGGAVVTTMTTASLASSGVNYNFRHLVTLKNNNTEASQQPSLVLVTTRGTSFVDTQQADVVSSVFDSSADFSLDFTVQASGAITGSAGVYFINVEYAYVP